jgi:hypothetical protein
MNESVVEILEKVVHDFDTKWSSAHEKGFGLFEYAVEIVNLLDRAPVTSSYSGWVSIREAAPQTEDRLFIAVLSKGERQYTVDRYFADRGLFKVETIVPGIEVTHWMLIPALECGG